MTDKEKEKHIQLLSQCVIEWQNLLKLNEWNIAVGIGSKEKMGIHNGTITYAPESGQALLTIIDKDEVTVYPFGYIEEVTVVEQLLRLRYETLHGLDDIYLARCHRIMASLLVELKQTADQYHRLLDEMSYNEPAEGIEKPEIKKAPEPVKRARIIDNA